VLYPHKEAVESYKNVLTVGIDPLKLDRLLQSIYLISKNSNPLEKINILDIGSGTGSIAIPFAKILKKRKIPFAFKIIDFSKKMIQVLKANLNDEHLEENFEIIETDLDNDQVLEKVFEGCSFRFIFCVRVLHQIKNWRDVLEQIMDHIIKYNTTFVFTESGGDLYTCLNFHIRLSDILREETREFYKLIQMHFKDYYLEYKNREKPKISAVDMTSALKIIKQRNNLALIEMGNICWHDPLSWNTYISAIQKQAFQPFVMPFMSMSDKFDMDVFNPVFTKFQNQAQRVWWEKGWSLDQSTNEELSIKFYVAKIKGN
jgi:ubiquinone/menaquinone biosynthesis C-methylase UbiE